MNFPSNYGSFGSENQGYLSLTGDERLLWPIGGVWQKEHGLEECVSGATGVVAVLVLICFKMGYIIPGIATTATTLVS